MWSYECAQIRRISRRSNVGKQASVNTQKAVAWSTITALPGGPAVLLRLHASRCPVANASAVKPWPRVSAAETASKNWRPAWRLAAQARQQYWNGRAGSLLLATVSARYCQQQAAEVVECAAEVPGNTRVFSSTSDDAFSLKDSSFRFPLSRGLIQQQHVLIFSQTSLHRAVTTAAQTNISVWAIAASTCG